MANKNNRFSMIEISLVPDIKRELLVAQRVRNQVSLIAIIVMASISSVAIILAMFIFIYQDQRLSSLESEATRLIDTIDHIEGASEMLTVQIQLQKINQIHKDKPIVSRIFYLMTRLAVNKGLSVKISNFEYDPHTKKVIISGKTEGGYADLDRFKKTILELKVVYRDIKKDKVEDDSKDQDQVDSRPLTDAVYLVSTPAIAREEGKETLRFKIGFKIEEQFFDNFDQTEVSISEIDEKDVTDSTLSIPESIFDDKPPKEDQENDSNKANQQTEES